MMSELKLTLLLLLPHDREHGSMHKCKHKASARQVQVLKTWVSATVGYSWSSARERPRLKGGAVRRTAEVIICAVSTGTGAGTGTGGKRRNGTHDP